MRKYILLFLFLSVVIFITNQVIAQNILTSYKQGYARNASEPKRPHLWKGKIGHWIPSLGVTGIKTLFDVSGHGTHGTLNGSMTLADWVIGRNGYALDFEGTDDFVECGSSSLFALDKFSVGLWLNVDTNDCTPISRMPTSPGPWGWNIYINTGASDGFVRIEIDTIGEAVTNFSGTTNILGSWHYVMFTYDGGGTGIARIYVDGIEENNRTYTGDSTIDYGADATLRIGERNVNEGTFIYDGRNENTHIYNRVLLPNEVMELYINPLADLELRGSVIAKAPVAAPAGIPIFRRRIESCNSCHDERFVTSNNDKICTREEDLSLAFND